MSDLSVVVAVALEPVVRATAIGGLLLDLPGSVAVDYRLRDATLRRTIGDRTGVVYDDEVPAEHCVSCAVRADLHSTLAAVQSLGRFDVAVVAPPLTSAPTPIVHELLHAHHGDRVAQIAVRSVVAYADAANLRHDLFGHDLLHERGLALSEHDRRSVGEALTAQVEFADAVVAVTGAGPTESTLLSWLAAADTVVHPDRCTFDGTALLDRTHDYDQACDRIDPLLTPEQSPIGLIGPADPADPPDPANGVWRMTLQSHRPLHPGRLMERLTALGTGRIRARGHFWLASRPAAACVWDAAGGQLSIGTLDGWNGRQPGTRVAVTGLDLADRYRIGRTFGSLAVTGDDLTAPSWLGGDDGFEPWLGAIA